MTSAWTSGIVAGVGTCVGTWGHRAPCTWVEAGRAAWCAEGGLTLLGGGQDYWGGGQYCCGAGQQYFASGQHGCGAGKQDYGGRKHSFCF